MVESVDTVSERITLDNGLAFRRLPESEIWFALTEVSRCQYHFPQGKQKVVQHKIQSSACDLPAMGIDWFSARDFAKRLTRIYRNEIPHGWEIRLPLGKEWDFAARCGSNRKYPWPGGLEARIGNYADVTFLAANPDASEGPFLRPSADSVRLYDDGHAGACRVNVAATNEWGIQGLGGNVREWLLDDSPVLEEAKSIGVLKGLSFACGGFAGQYAVSSRVLAPRKEKIPDAGIRLVLAPSQGTVKGATH